MIKSLIISVFLLFSMELFGQSTELRPSNSTGKEYTDNQIDWLKVYLEAEVRAIKAAVDKVAVETSARFEAQNEWRGQFRDQAGKFVTKGELWTSFIGLIGLAIAGLKILNDRNNKHKPL